MALLFKKIPLCFDCWSDLERNYKEDIIFKYDENIKELLHLFKDLHIKEVANVFKPVVEEFKKIGWTFCIPPSSMSATKERGFVPMKLIVPYAISPFAKTKDYKQSKLKYEDRKASIKLTTHKLPPRIMLIDDVKTSGKTLNECKRLLEAKGCLVKTLAISSSNYMV